MSKQKIYIFHYHLNNGGITTIIKESIKLLKKSYEIYVVSSTKCSENLDCEIIYTPLLGYKSNFSLEEFKNQEQEIIKFIYSIISSKDDILIFHNFHLGKNIAFTSAILNLVSSINNKIILYIHDFPEDGRKYNYKIIKKMMGYRKSTNIYPNLENVFYVSINKRDFNLLNNLGLNVSFIQNPISNIYSETIVKRDFKSYLKEIKINENLLFDFDKPVVLYPVRSIRRKNILEAIFLSKLIGFNLIVTLPGISEGEIKYSNLISSFNGKIEGIFNLGKKYSNLLKNSYPNVDYVISTSVKEGSGLAFYESVLNNKAFIYRELEGVLDKSESSYNLLRVKLEIKDIKIIKELYNFDIIDENYIDFSFLPVNLQLKYIEKLDLIKISDLENIKKIFDKKIVQEKINKNSYLPDMIQLINKKQIISKNSLKSINDIEKFIYNSFDNYKNKRGLLTF